MIITRNAALYSHHCLSRKILVAGLRIEQAETTQASPLQANDRSAD